MTSTAHAWAVLGAAIRRDRVRQGMKSRRALVDRVRERGGSVSERTIGSIERGDAPERGVVPASVEQTVAALGWPQGAVERILAGEDPEVVLSRPDATGVAAGSAVVVEAKSAALREVVLEALPGVFAWGRDAVAAGADPRRRDEFDAAAQRLVESLPAGAQRDTYGLAAYRPHAEGEGVDTDDVERIMRATDRERG